MAGIAARTWVFGFGVCLQLWLASDTTIRCVFGTFNLTLCTAYGAGQKDGSWDKITSYPNIRHGSPLSSSLSGLSKGLSKRYKLLLLPLAASQWEVSIAENITSDTGSRTPELKLT